MSGCCDQGDIIYYIGSSIHPPQAMIRLANYTGDKSLLSALCAIKVAGQPTILSGYIGGVVETTADDADIPDTDVRVTMPLTSAALHAPGIFVMRVRLTDSAGLSMTTESSKRIVVKP